MHNIEFRSGKTTRVLFVILGILVVLHLIVVFFHTVLHMKVEALTQLVDLDLEANLPTFFNCSLFFVGAVLFYLHGKAAAAGQKRSGWFLMTAVFIFLGIDEGSQIHEKFMLITHRLLLDGEPVGGALDWFNYAWVIPYGLAALVLVVTLSKWLMQLDPKLRNGLVISGVIYVFGAVFLEMVGGKLAAENYAPPTDFPWLPCRVYLDPSGCWMYMDPTYITLYTLEEICEMSGLILCIRFLMKAFERRGLLLSLGVKPLE